jgi:hypothetical protein
MIDVCTPNPCLNNGNCIRNSNIQDGMYKCECPIGTTGIYCEEKESSCSRISCLNGGTCLMNEINNISYCQCPSNTTGNR